MLDAMKNLFLPPAVALDISLGFRTHLPVLGRDLKHARLSKVVMGAHV